MEKVTIGRIVHYVLASGEHRPAIVVQVWKDEYPENADDKDGVNVQVFLDGKNDLEKLPYGAPNYYRPTIEECERGTMWGTSARYSNLHEPWTWHWPEHVGDTHA